MKYLLDSNAIIALLNRSSVSLAKQVRKHRPDAVATSAIVLQELFYGAFKSQLVERNLAALEELRFAVMPFEQSDAREAGEIRAFLRKRGTTIGPYDVLIAGHARARGLILITHNAKEFVRVPDLRVEDWQN
jgi:tRNA(fMet)-specific endonuclease VapC